MKLRISLLILLAMVISIPCFAAPPVPDPDASYCAQVAAQDPIELKRGCCSWHGGVCGCKNDRAVCCDGQFSPTCGCN